MSECKITCTKESFVNYIQQINNYMQKDKVYSIEVKPKRKSRSLDANALYWKLVGKLSDVLHIGKDELHGKMIAQYGQYLLDDNNNPVVISSKNRIKDCPDVYVHYMGKSCLNGDTFYHYHLMRGSSTYTTEEFAVLLDGLIGECDALDIPTEDKEDIERLVNMYDRK